MILKPFSRAALAAGALLMTTQPQAGWGRGGVEQGFKRAILTGVGVSQLALN